MEALDEVVAALAKGYSAAWVAQSVSHTATELVILVCLPDGRQGNVRLDLPDDNLVGPSTGLSWAETASWAGDVCELIEENIQTGRFRFRIVADTGVPDLLLGASRSGREL